MPLFIVKLKFPAETTHHVCFTEKGAWALVAASSAAEAEVCKVVTLKRVFKNDWIPWAGG